MSASATPLLVGGEECSVDQIVAIVEGGTPPEILAKEWPDLALALGASSQKVKRLQDAIKQGKVTVNYAISDAIELWVENEGESGTLDAFVTILKSCGLDNSAEAIRFKYGLANSSRNESGIVVGSQDCPIDQVVSTLEDAIDFRSLKSKLAIIGTSLGLPEIRGERLENNIQQKKITLAYAVNDMIEQWTEMKGNSALLHNLIRVLMENGLEDCADSLKAKFNANVKPTTPAPFKKATVVESSPKDYMMELIKEQKKIVEDGGDRSTLDFLLKNMEVGQNRGKLPDIPKMEESKQKSSTGKYSDEEMEDRSNRTVNMTVSKPKSTFTLSDALEGPSELNILILGETGVGKSTWINGFRNFLTYASLDEAEEGQLLTLIPSKFTVCNENFDNIDVITGQDANEVFSDGQSATQDAKVYPFDIGNTKIRLIDTPGIGDTRGVDQDKRNFQNILNTLSGLDVIHGICILLKPNNARLNVMFRFCILELLTYLHRDASKNIMFCFTNSRGTFYRPGDTMPALKKLLEANQEVKIPLNRETIYCFDSEAYRFLAAVKNRPPVSFPPEEKVNFGNSWQKSIEETIRMLEYIRNLPPHEIHSTLSLNNARELVLKLARPLAEISRNIQTNKSILEDRMREIQNCKDDIKELKKKQMTKRTEIEVKPINHPKTVCSNGSCVKVWNMNDVTTTEYVKVCHSHCHLEGVQQDTVGDPGLIKCWAMQGSENCHKCSHSYREHLHVYYDSIQVVKEVEDESVKEALQKNLSAAEMKEKMISAKNAEIAELEGELQSIQEASATFAYFLKNNAITPYNDAMEEYLNHLIREEEDKVKHGGSRKAVENLRISLDAYIQHKLLLEAEMKKGGAGRRSPPGPADIENLVNALKNLKHSGKSLKDALDCVQRAKQNSFAQNVIMPVKNGGGVRGFFKNLIS